MPEVKLSLETLQEGAIVERFNLALDQVLRNIANPNTKAKEKRKITVEVVFDPSEERDGINIMTKVGTKLAQLRPVESRGYIEETGDGGFVALETHRNQLRGQVEIQENTMMPDDPMKETMTNVRTIKAAGKAGKS